MTTVDESSPMGNGGAVLRVSSKTGEGLDALTEAMNTRLFANRDETEDIGLQANAKRLALKKLLQASTARFRLSARIRR